MESQTQYVPMVVAQPQQRQTVLWIIAILLAVIATALLVRTPIVSQAYADSPMLGARGIHAFTGQIDKNSYGLFMMDVDNKTVWCYQYVPSIRKLKLVAARSFMYDQYLEDFNNDQETTPKAVKLMLDDAKRIKDRVSQGGIEPDDPSDMTGSAVKSSTDGEKTSNP